MIRLENVGWLLAILFLWCSFAPHGAAQEWDTPIDLGDEAKSCVLSLRVPGEVSWRGARSRGYEPEAASTHRESIIFEVRNSGGSCSYEVGVAPVGGVAKMIGRQGALSYLLKSEDSGSSVDTGDQLIMQGEFHHPGGTAYLGFLVEMVTGQYVPAGTYSSDIEITLFTSLNGSLSVVDTRFIRLSSDVWSRVHASIGGRADGAIASSQINLGQLKTGLDRELDFSVYANSAYRIILESENQMRLKHENAILYVPYALTLDGVPIDLDRLIDVNTISEGVTGRLHDFRLRVGRVEAGHPAGRYSDRLIVTIQADQ